MVSLIDKISAGEANAAEAFSAWAEVCTTDHLRTSLRMIVEREESHARVFRISDARSRRGVESGRFGRE